MTLILVVGALGSLGGREPLDFSEAFRTPPRVGRRRAGDQDRFIPGRAAPINVVMGYAGAGAVTLDADPRARTPVQEMYLIGGFGSPEGQESELALARPI